MTNKDEIKQLYTGMMQKLCEHEFVNRDYDPNTWLQKLSSKKAVIEELQFMMTVKCKHCGLLTNYNDESVPRKIRDKIEFDAKILRNLWTEEIQPRIEAKAFAEKQANSIGNNEK